MSVKHEESVMSNVQFKNRKFIESLLDCRLIYCTTFTIILLFP